MRRRRAGPSEPSSDAVTHLHQPHRRSQARSCPAADLAVRRHAHRHAPAAGGQAPAPKPARHGVVVAPRAARPALRPCAGRAGEKRPRQGLSAGSSRAGAHCQLRADGVRPPPYRGTCPPRRDSCPGSAPPRPRRGCARDPQPRRRLLDERSARRAARTCSASTRQKGAELARARECVGAGRKAGRTRCTDPRRSHSARARRCPLHHAPRGAPSCAKKSALFLTEQLRRAEPFVVWLGCLMDSRSLPRLVGCAYSIRTAGATCRETPLAGGNDSRRSCALLAELRTAFLLRTESR